MQSDNMTPAAFAVAAEALADVIYTFSFFLL
jgi:hypothetical protein